MSTFLKIPTVEQGVKQLSDDLKIGKCYNRNTELHDKDELDVGYRIAVWDG